MGNGTGCALHILYRCGALHGYLRRLTKGCNGMHVAKSSRKKLLYTLYPATKCHYGDTQALCRTQHSRGCFAVECLSIYRTLARNDQRCSLSPMLKVQQREHYLYSRAHACTKHGV